MSRTIIIGDLHGCFAEAVKLLALCDVQPEDRVIFIGDLVDRGPDSDQCVDLAIATELRQGQPAAILGNHEDVHLKYQLMDFMGAKVTIKSDTHVYTRRQLTAEHYRYLRTLPLFIRLPEYNAVVVHAGVFPGVPIEQQKKDHLLHLQMINPDVGDRTLWPSQSSEGWKFWTHLWDGPERIIFGHSNLDKPLVTDKVVGIDGGACFGGELRAVILPSWEIVSVQASHNYGKGSRGRSNLPIQKFVIHDDVSTFS